MVPKYTFGNQFNLNSCSLHLQPMVTSATKPNRDGREMHFCTKIIELHESRFCDQYRRFCWWPSAVIASHRYMLFSKNEVTRATGQ